MAVAALAVVLPEQGDVAGGIYVADQARTSAAQVAVRPTELRWRAWRRRQEAVAIRCGLSTGAAVAGSTWSATARGPAVRAAAGAAAVGAVVTPGVDDTGVNSAAACTHAGGPAAVGCNSSIHARTAAAGSGRGRAACTAHQSGCDHEMQTDDCCAHTSPPRRGSPRRKLGAAA